MKGIKKKYKINNIEQKGGMKDEQKKKIDVVVYKITTEEKQKIRNMFGKMNLECEFKQALDENGNVCKDGQISFMKMPEDAEDPNNEIFEKLFGQEITGNDFVVGDETFADLSDIEKYLKKKNIV